MLRDINPQRVFIRRPDDEKRHHPIDDHDLSMSRERRTIPLVRELSAAAKDCPLAPPAHASVYARTLHRACLVLGGVDQLAKHLDVPVADLGLWLRGEKLPPERVFLAAVEVVLLHAGARGRSN
jgi:hypothetical protein